MIDVLKDFAVGSVSGMTATCIIQPIDMIKVRVQLAGEKGGERNPFAIMRTMLAEEGFLAMYKGLDAALSRQLVYAGLRLGLFKTFSDLTSTHFNNGGPNSFGMKVVNSLAAGGIGAFLANPVDLALVRMQGDNFAPVEQRKGYKNVVDTIVKIVKSDGISGLWRGAMPTV
mmetsp:Transcript_114092/g.245403  ORF Transcript_114092/g.245403 Transcript_114092/m.245403 type:complete len:171 (+) Transcript_114092:17-529(+)